MNHVHTIKATLKAAVEEKLESTRKLRTYKAAPWAPEDVHKRAYEIARQRSVRRDLRADIRCLQLAYAYSRGRPYKQQEPKVREGNAPPIIGVLMLLPEASKETLEAWYKGETPVAVPEAAAQPEAAE